MADFSHPQALPTTEDRASWQARLHDLWFRRRAWIGFVFIAPWFLGFLIFDAYPFVYNLYLGFTDHTMGGALPAPWVGLDNYVEMFTQDEVFGRSFFNTIYYLVFSVPIGLALAFLIALLLNTRMRGMDFFRTAFYIPTVVPAVAVAVIFGGLLDFRYGFINQFLVQLGFDPIRWLSRPEWVKPSFIILSLWGFGAQMIIFLAGLQSISADLYEAAAIDGASGWHRLVRITIPLMTPTIFFNLLIGLINGFQIFTQAYVLIGADGGPLQSGLFYMVNVYNNAFWYFRMGYAAAMSAFLFVVIIFFSLILVWSSNRWVFYGDD